MGAAALVAFVGGGGGEGTGEVNWLGFVRSWWILKGRGFVRILLRLEVGILLNAGALSVGGRFGTW